MTEQAARRKTAKLLAAAAAKYHVSENSILNVAGNDSDETALCRAVRRKIFSELRARNVAFAAIGRIFGVNHTTVKRAFYYGPNVAHREQRLLNAAARGGMSKNRNENAAFRLYAALKGRDLDSRKAFEIAARAFHAGDADVWNIYCAKAFPHSYANAFATPPGAAYGA